MCRTDGVAMDAAGFSIVDNRAGVTFGVEIYVPWDAPEEMTTDLSANGTVPLHDVQDVFGMCGHRKGATESRILQGRDVCSVRVLVPDCRGLEQNLYDAIVVDLRPSLPKGDRRSRVVWKWRIRRRLWVVITDRPDVRSLADAYPGSRRHPHELHPT